MHLRRWSRVAAPHMPSLALFGFDLVRCPYTNCSTAILLAGVLSSPLMK